MEPVKEKISIIDIILTLLGIGMIVVCCLYKFNHWLPSFELAKEFYKTPVVQKNDNKFTSKVQTDNNVDFNAYMEEMKKKIKSNWNPPKEDESRHVVLLYKIAKDGNLLGYRVLESSGSSEMNSAAIDALKASAPFKPLPDGFKGQSIDVSFTFDYNVFNASK